MALNILGPTKSNYFVEEVHGEEEEDLMVIEPFGEEYEQQFRPSLADRLQIGFLRSDKHTQTDETEILEIKLVSDTVKQLLKNMTKLKEDLIFTKQVVEAKYKEDLQITSNKLYEKLHHRLGELEKIHEERVGVVRRSFKQQLQDALVKMAAQYKKYYEAKMAGKVTPASGNSNKNKILQLQSEIQKYKSTIQMLELQINQLQDELASKPDVAEIKIDTSELDALQEQNDALKEEVSKLNSKCDDLSDSLEFREERIQQLQRDLEDANREIEKQKNNSKRLAQKLEDLKKEKDADKNSARQEMDRQRAALEREMAAQLHESKNASQNFENEKLKILEECRLETERKLEEQRLKFEEKLKESRSILEQQKEEMKETKSIEQVLSKQKSEIGILRQRLEKNNKQWEKKFAILRSSLHALKDESYLRLQLQKQSATLKYASISYGGENTSRPSVVPPSEPGPPSVHTPKGGLPAIHPRSGVFVKPPTNTMPSGPGTDIFTEGAMDSEDEHDAEESEIASFLPLPTPPTWEQQKFGEYMPPTQQFQ